MDFNDKTHSNNNNNNNNNNKNKKQTHLQKHYSYV